MFGSQALNTASYRIFFNDTAPTEIYALSLLDALPIYGHPGWHPVSRHALQLLRPDVRMAQGDRLLHEEGRAHLLGGAVLAALLGGELFGCGARRGRDRGGVPARGPAGGARDSGGAVLPQRRHQLTHQAAPPDPGRGTPPGSRRLGRGLSQAAAAWLIRLPPCWRAG